MRQALSATEHSRQHSPLIYEALQSVFGKLDPVPSQALHEEQFVGRLPGPREWDLAVSVKHLGRASHGHSYTGAQVTARDKDTLGIVAKYYLVFNSKLIRDLVSLRELRVSYDTGTDPTRLPPDKTLVIRSFSDFGDPTSDEYYSSDEDRRRWWTLSWALPHPRNYDGARLFEALTAVSGLIIDSERIARRIKRVVGCVVDELAEYLAPYESSTNGD